MPDRIVLFIVGAIVLPLAGCGGGTEPESDPLVKPMLGSYYTFNNSSLDASGHIISTRLDTLYVESTTEALAGMSGLTRLVNRMTDDTLHLRYDVNGDIAVIMRADSNHDGVAEALRAGVYPAGIRRSVENGRDTVGDINGGHTALADSTLYLGEQSVTTPGGTFKVAKVVDVLDIRSYNQSSLISRAREVSTYYYARSIGFFVKIVSSIERFDENDKLTSDEPGTRLELTGYGK
jgi:hypothetical protein